jgi:hypothetical protein
VIGVDCIRDALIVMVIKRVQVSDPNEIRWKGKELLASLRAFKSRSSFLNAMPMDAGLTDGTVCGWRAKPAELAAPSPSRNTRAISVAHLRLVVRLHVTRYLQHYMYI